MNTFYDPYNWIFLNILPADHGLGVALYTVKPGVVCSIPPPDHVIRVRL